MRLRDNREFGYTIGEAQTQYGVAPIFMLWVGGEMVHRPIFASWTEGSAVRRARAMLRELYPERFV
jgi:hypothetical protein